MTSEQIELINKTIENLIERIKRLENQMDNAFKLIGNK